MSASRDELLMIFVGLPCCVIFTLGIYYLGIEDYKYSKLHNMNEDRNQCMMLKEEK